MGWPGRRAPPPSLRPTRSTAPLDSTLKLAAWLGGLRAQCPVWSSHLGPFCKHVRTSSPKRQLPVIPSVRLSVYSGRIFRPAGFPAPVQALRSPRKTRKTQNVTVLNSQLLRGFCQGTSRPQVSRRRKPPLAAGWTHRYLHSTAMAATARVRVFASPNLMLALRIRGVWRLHSASAAINKNTHSPIGAGFCVR